MCTQSSFVYLYTYIADRHMIKYVTQFAKITISNTYASLSLVVRLVVK